MCLSSTPDEYIKTWLDHERRFSGVTFWNRIERARLTVLTGSIQTERSSLASGFSDSRFSTASWSTNNTSLSCLSSLSQPPTAIENLESNEIAQDSDAQHERKIALYLNKPHPPIPQGLRDSTVAAQESGSSIHGSRHERWCTTREHQTVFTTYRGFAKHENEHDSCFVFLPQGPIERTPWGLQCALCETPNPSKAHLQYHDILQYEGRLGKPITRSRKGNFEELLKKHKASEEKIKMLMNKWRHVRNKKAYSCGFCISIFKRLPDRSSHIDREHYAKGKHIDDWNDTFVIKGLLLQREVKQECMILFRPVDPTVVETRISWPPSVVDDLQLRLELGDEAAKDLATDVFRQASTRGALSYTRRNAASKLRPRSEVTGHIQTPSSTPVVTSFERGPATDPVQFPNQDSDSFEGPQAQHQVYNDDQNTRGISHMSVSSPSSNSQLLKINSSFPFPTRSSSLAASATGNTGFMYPTPGNAYEAARIPLTSRMPHNVLPSYELDHVGVDESSNLESSYFVRSMPDSNLYQVSSFDASVSEVTSHTAFQLESFQDNASQTSHEPSITFQAPKRKLSDKSAKEANLKAQTQAPVLAYNQQYSIASSGLGTSNTQAVLNWH